MLYSLITAYQILIRVGEVELAVDFIPQCCENEMRDLILIFSNCILSIKNPRKFRKKFEDCAEIIS